jgi:hypothetical protein
MPTPRLPTRDGRAARLRKREAEPIVTGPRVSGMVRPSPRATSREVLVIVSSRLGLERSEHVTEAEALAQAQRRLGPQRHVREASPLHPSQQRCIVRQRIDSVFFIYGRGTTWEEAFRDADAGASGPTP